MDGLGTILGIALGPYLPGDNETVKSMLGATIGNFTMNLGRKVISTSTGLVGKCFNKKYYCLTVDKEENNPIYLKIQKYIVNKHLEIMNKCKLEPHNGEIIFTIKDSRFRKPITDTFKGHTMILKINSSQKSKSSTNSDGSTNNNTNAIDDSELEHKINISSKTAKIPIIKEFIDEICQFKKDSEKLTIYRALKREIDSDNKKSNTSAVIYWSEITSINNKRIANTILSEKNNKDIYEDIKTFMDSEDRYNEKGIPYNRGYLLHGQPGTGKTSNIKSIAAEYKLPVFMIQMDIINDDSQLIKLFTSISEHIGTKRYVLVFEDFDRCSVFTENWRSKSNVSMSAILNELDGIAESHGRLFFITANNRDRFNNVEDVHALFRPGRIDKICEISHCTPKQTQKLVKHLIGMDIELDKVGEKNITPAQLTSLLHKNMDSEEALKELKEKILNHDVSSLAAKEDILGDSINPANGRRRVKYRGSSLKRYRDGSVGVINRRKSKIKHLNGDIKKIRKKYRSIKKIKETIAKQEDLLEKSVQADKKRKAKDMARRAREKAKKKIARK